MMRVVFFLLMVPFARCQAENLFHCSTTPPEIYPAPIEAEYLDRYHPFATSDGQSDLMLLADGADAHRAARLFNRQLELMGLSPLPMVEDTDLRPPAPSVLIRFRRDNTIQKENHEQAYAIRPATENGFRIIEARGGGRKGLLYSATALSQLVCLHQGQPAIREAVIQDRPAYGRRIFKTDPAPEQVADLLSWMVRYRMSCLAIQGRRYAWWEVESEFADLLSAYSRWNEEYGGVDLMVMFNLYVGQQIVMADSAHLQGLRDVVTFSLERGATSLMLLADDTPPFQYGEGYILTDERDKARFQTMAEAHCFLFHELKKWLEAADRRCELYYVPAFYTYEEMHCGDMSLFLDTPWEADVFGPFRRDHGMIGRDMPGDVSIIWCGPHVRSRRITEADLQDWTGSLGGRVPFLWDNTIYSHHPFTTTTLFTAYDTELPQAFHLKTAGNGMFVNGDAAAEISRVPSMTANEYLWNPDQYEPGQSLRRAIAHLYGPDAVGPALTFREAELGIRRMIGEKLLWEEADSLWAATRRTRSITDKNPFFYHQNYSRLKALQFQLKHSVPVPGPPEALRQSIEGQLQQRETALDQLYSLGLIRLEEALRQDMMKKDNPSFQKAVGAE